MAMSSASSPVVPVVGSGSVVPGAGVEVVGAAAVVPSVAAPLVVPSAVAGPLPSLLSPPLVASPVVPVLSLVGSLQADWRASRSGRGRANFGAGMAPSIDES